MGQNVSLYSAESSPVYGWIIFSDPTWVPEYGCRCTFAREGDEWTVDLTMIPPYQHDMLGFFEEMARDSDGWSGTKSWASEDHEVEIDVQNNGRVATLSVTMRWPPAWHPEPLGTIDVDPAELPRLAREMTRFVGLERGERPRT